MRYLSLIACDMAEPVLKDIVREGLKRKGLSARRASIEATGKDSLVKNIFEDREPSFYKIEKLFAVLGINLTYSFDDDPQPAQARVPLLGYVAAGGDDLPADTSVTYTASDNAIDEVPAPPGTFMRMRGSMFALEVKGGSMEPIYEDGDRLYVYKDDPARADINRLIGRKCVVTLENDDVYVKTLRRSDDGDPDHWNLESLNPAWPVMRDRQIAEALPVRHVTHRF